ncbi:MAG: hypothetical protein RIQ56_738 [Candidatus Parcubacteria bacterium]|jgi:uncharacterized membrane protein YphA (DoxX/SURF4 family)
MLSLFPFALSFAVFAPLLLRIALAATLLIASQEHFAGNMYKRGLAIIEFAASIFLILGLWTQPAAGVSVLIIASWLFGNSPYPKSTVLLAMVIACSLIILGPGKIAFDLPL